MDIRLLVTSSSLLVLDKWVILILLIVYETSLIKFTFSLLFFTIENFDETIFSSTIGIDIVSRAWSEERHQSGWMEWLLSSVKPLHKNIKSMTKFNSSAISKYLVRTQWIGNNRSRLKESAMIIRSSLIAEWWGKDRS